MASLTQSIALIAVSYGRCTSSSMNVLIVVSLNAFNRSIESFFSIFLKWSLS